MAPPEKDILKPLMDEIEANKIDERLFLSENFGSGSPDKLSQDSISLDFSVDSKDKTVKVIKKGAKTERSEDSYQGPHLA